MAASDASRGVMHPETLTTLALRPLVLSLSNGERAPLTLN